MGDDGRPEIFLQWKGTDACLDLYCTCGDQFHFDGYFASELTCGKCGQTYELPHMLAITPAEPSHQLKIVFGEQAVIQDGEFTFTWPRPVFPGPQPLGIFEIHDQVNDCQRSAYVDFIKAVPGEDGTVAVTVRNRGVSP